jgi:hypothetical protein
MRHLFLSVPALVLALSAGTSAQAGLIANYHDNLNSGNNSLFIFGAPGAVGTISGNDGFSQGFTVGASGVFELSLGISGREMDTVGSNNLSIRVDSANPISGLALNRASFTSDMTTLFDIDGLSSEYRVLATPGVSAGSQMSVTAVEDGTTVTINSPISLDGNPANSPIVATLNAGESVFYSSGQGGDISGTHVTSSKDVAVFAGAQCTLVPVGTIACDHLIAQQVGVENFDTTFQIAKNFGGGSDGDLLRIIAAEDGTEVFLGGVSQGFIDQSEVLEIDNVGDATLTTSAPVMVGQFVRGQGGTRTTGDPAFAIVPSVSQQLDEYVFAAPTGSDVFAQNFLNIAIDEAIAGSLLLDGVSVDTTGFTLLNGTLFGNIPIFPGVGTLSASDTFLATISGFSDFDSYFSPVATSFSPGASPPPLTAVPLPSTFYLLMVGLVGVFIRTRRNRLGQMTSA